MTEKNTKKNNSRHGGSDLLRSLKKKLIFQGAFILTALLLTAVLLFALTAAWFTNVIGADGLSFTAKKWNFDGQFTIEDGAVSMSPGSRGIIPMRISNQGEETAIAGVTAEKSDFSEAMKKRVYFYVNTPYYRNGERMERVYITEDSSYSYTLFSGSEIVINEKTQSAPPVMWEWVYDVLGYYVKGRADANSGELTPEQYIRPIEYGYDPIFTTFNDDGSLKTLDGAKTAEELLAELSRTDGYKGEIDTEKKNAKGYYPVDVNSEGYGVWAYLYGYDEIQAAMAEDEQIGGESIRCSATITVTGVNARDDAIEVGSSEMLASILNGSDYADVKLSGDIALDQRVELRAGASVSIDLNGYTLASNAADNIINAAEGSKVTLSNGTLEGNGTKYGIAAAGAQVAVSNATIKGVVEGIKISDHQSTSGMDSRVHIVNSRIEGGDDAVWLYGNGGTDTKTVLIVEGSELIGANYMGICCNGSYTGTEIQIKNSTVKGYYTSIYHPQMESSMTVSGSTLEGRTGIAVKGGQVDIIDCTVLGTGPAGEPKFTVSGFTSIGAGVYLETNYEGEKHITISGDKTNVSSVNGKAVLQFEEADESASISISGGAYSTSVERYLADKAVQTEENGSFKVSRSAQ